METTIKIDIDDYLTDEDIREICKEQVAYKVQSYLGDEQNTKRVLSNLSYEIIFDEVDRHLGESSKEIIRKNTLKIINDLTNYSVFRDNSYGGSKSMATNIMEESVRENKELIKDKVREAISNKDFSEEVWTKFEQLGEDFMSNIYSLIEMVSKKD